MTSPEDDLVASALVSSYVDAPHFVTRPWLAEEVARALDEPECRFVVLTGAPGMGKSTFVAQLARQHPGWAVYFVRRDQRTARADVGVRSFLLRIGLQLAAAHADLFEPQQLALAVEQRVGVVGAGGEVVGAEVRRLLASPFHRQAATIRQNIKVNRGRAVGLRIDEVVADAASLSIDQLHQMALTDPAAAAAARHPGLRIVILIDGLDELRYQPTDEPLLQWLAGLAVPANVRFVVTTRPADSLVTNFLAKQRPVVRLLDLSEMTEPLHNDTRTFAHRMTERTPADQRQAVADRLIDKAQGNIGYLDAFARGLSGDDELSIDLLDRTPDELTSLHGFFLSQIRSRLTERTFTIDDPEPRFIDAWTAAVKPALSVLAVAYEPLALGQLHRLGRVVVDLADFSTAVDWLLPFLDRHGDGLRLYHASLREFLVDQDTDPQTVALQVNEATWHRRVADRYWRDIDENGEPADDYGVRTLARHLWDADDDRLAQLIDLPWLETRHHHDGRHFAGFLNDLALGESAAARHGALAESFRLRAIRSVIQKQAEMYQEEHLFVLAFLGRETEAIAHARARGSVDQLGIGLATIGEAQARTGTVSSSLIAEVHQLASASSSPDLQVHFGLLAARWRALSGESAFDDALADADAIALPSTRARMLALVAVAMLETGQAAASSTVDKAVRAALEIPDDSSYIWSDRSADQIRQRDWTLRDIAVQLADAGQIEPASRLAEALPRNPYSGPAGTAFVAIVAAHLAASDTDGATRAAEDIEEEIARDSAHRLIARHHARRGRPDEADLAVSRIVRQNAVQDALCEIAVEFSRANLPDEADRAVEQVDSGLTRLVALVQMACVDGARRDVLLLAAAAEMDEVAPYSRAEALCWLAFGRAHAGDAEGAYQLLNDALPDAAEPIEDIGETGRGISLMQEFDDLRPRPDQSFRGFPSPGTPGEALFEIGIRLVEHGKPDSARLLAEYMDERYATTLLCHIAVELAWQGSQDTAEVWAVAEQSIAPAPSSESPAALVGALASGLTPIAPQAATRLFSLALDLAQGSRDEVLRKICRSLCLAGNVDEARSMLKEIDDGESRTQAHRDIVVSLAESGDFAAAEAAAADLDRAYWSAECWWTIGIARLRAADVPEGMECLSHLFGPEYRPGAAAGATRTLCEAGDVTAAVRFPADIGWDNDPPAVAAWATVLTENGVPAETDSAELSPGLLEALAEAAARGTDEAGTHRLLDRVEDTDTADSIRWLATLRAAHRGDTGAADRWLATITGEPARAFTLAHLARETALTEPDLAADLLRQAETAIAELPEDDTALPTLILSAAWRHVDGERADEILDDLVAALRAEGHHPLGAQSDLLMAIKLAEVGDPRVIRLIEAPEAVSLRPLVVTLLDSDLPEVAVQVAELESLDRDDSFLSICYALVRAGQFDRALDIAGRITAPDDRDTAREVVCDGLATNDRLTDAIRELDGYPQRLLAALARWAPQLHQIAPGSVQDAIASVVTVLAWIDHRWADIEPAMSDALDRFGQGPGPDVRDDVGGGD